MNWKIAICLSLVIVFTYSCKHKTSVTKPLQELLTQKNYFRLDEQYKAVSNELADSDKLYYKAFIDNAFNRNTDCITDVDLWLRNAIKPSDSIRYRLKSLQEDSYFKTFQYAKAAQCDSDILKSCKSLSKETLDDVKNDLIIRNGLKNTPPQQTIIKHNTTIHYTKNKLGLVEVAVGTNSQIFDAIWDTRANISSISRTYAKKLGLRMLNINYNESSGITGITFKTDMGVADSLEIGGLVMKNVIFQVMPDSILYLANFKLQLNVILGYPAIGQWGEVHFYQNGIMTIPVTPSHSQLLNFALDGLDPVIALICGKDTLPFL